MGCDIHFWIEEQKEDGKWYLLDQLTEGNWHYLTEDERAERIARNPDNEEHYKKPETYIQYVSQVVPEILKNRITDPNKHLVTKEGEYATETNSSEIDGLAVIYDDYEGGYEPHDAFDPNRNYALFNYFSGVRGGNPKPLVDIHQTNGVPSDCCKEIRDEFHKWSGDGHNYGHLYLNQILDANWDEVLEFSGYLALNTYGEFIRNDRFPYYWADEPRKNAFVYENPDKALEIYDFIIDFYNKYQDDKSVSKDTDFSKLTTSLVRADTLNFDEIRKHMSELLYRTFVYHAWTQTRIDFIGVNKWINRLRRIKGDPNQIRCVFWYDN